ncbi:MAG: RNA polymerase sigma factor [Candidatus Pacebacteria bacterium]|nr:RNA polymerase sigma factor [Candidatus Paceibacterota bacterium]
MPDKQENTENFAGFYDKHVKKIFNFIYYKTHHKETAEDLTQETFMKALDSFKNFDLKKGKFSTWLYQIARNTVIDFYRTKKNFVNVDDVWDLAGKENILRDLDVSGKLKDVEKYLAKLKPEQREIVILRVWEGYSYKEIAEILGKNEVNCRVVFSRTIHTLKNEMPLSVFIAMLLFRF